jgi:AcrR family transcriptional regulator
VADLLASPRVRRTDRAICAASVRVAAREGWGEFTFARVAREAGTSRRPLQDRFDGRSELAATTWGESVEPVLRGLLVQLLASAGLLQVDVDRDRFIAVIDEFAHPSPELQAAVELLIVAQFDAAVRGAVQGTLGGEIAQWCSPVPGELSPEDAARRAFVISVGLGLVLVARRPGVERIDIARVGGLLLDAITARSEPRAVPDGFGGPDQPSLSDFSASHIDASMSFDTGDAVRDRLLRATLDIVGEIGYDAATVDAIAQRALSSQGALFARYPTKAALFLDASRRQAAHSMRAHEEWMSRIEAEHGRGVAEAAFIRESQRPGRDHLRILALEQMRTGWHEPSLREAMTREYAAFIAEAHATKPGFTVAEGHVALAVGGGTLLLSVLCPDAWLLPYDVVTVAWEG